MKVEINQTARCTIAQIPMGSYFTYNDSDTVYQRIGTGDGSGISWSIISNKEYVSIDVSTGRIGWDFGETVVIPLEIAGEPIQFHPK